MKKQRNAGVVTLGLLCVGLLAATAGVARATTVTMSLSGEPYSTYTSSGAYNGLLSGTGQIIGNGEWIGIYSFDNITVDPNSGPGSISISSPLYAVCLSPAGNLGGGPVTYTVGPLSGTGQRPAEWANPVGAPNAGILNAYWLFATLSGQIEGGGILAQNLALSSTADQGTALALAMYTALYNSTGYGAGTFLATGGAFSLPNLTGDVLDDYKGDLLALTGVNTSLYPAGSVLISPGTANGGQDMEVMATPIPQSIPVPEPATVLAGVLLLLPFGASAFRIIQNRKTGAV